MNDIKKWFIVLTFIALLSGCHKAVVPAERWSLQRVNEWYAERPWPVGCDYVPAYAGNQIQMWQESTWDSKAIDRELGWAEELGFNTVRVFLHHKVWQEEKKSFFANVEQFLKIANKHHISVLVTLFTNGGSEERSLNEHIKPIPGIHNSIWAQTPGISIVNDPTRWDEVKAYEQDVLKHFKNDERIVAWCLYNEPENVKACHTMPLLEKVFQWAREVNPSQPLTAPVMALPFSSDKYPIERFPMVNFICAQSDIISFHCYKPYEDTERFAKLMLTFGRPVFCTEYMSRTFGSTFQSIMPLLKQHKIAAYSFGLVNGATQCHYEWNKTENGNKIPFTQEPSLWMHDILHPDGMPYDEEEVRFIKGMCKDNKD